MGNWKNGWVLTKVFEKKIWNIITNSIRHSFDSFLKFLCLVCLFSLNDKYFSASAMYSVYWQKNFFYSILLTKKLCEISIGDIFFMKWIHADWKNYDIGKWHRVQAFRVFGFKSIRKILLKGFEFNYKWEYIPYNSIPWK